MSQLKKVIENPLPLKHILALQKWKQVYIILITQLFTFGNFRMKHPVEASSIKPRASINCSE